jgi:hypothetical protein
MFEIKFTFNGVNRKRALPSLPGLGDIVDLEDGDQGRIILKVETIVHFEENNAWSYHCNGIVMTNWLEKQIG